MKLRFIILAVLTHFLLTTGFSASGKNTERVANIINFIRATEPRRAFSDYHSWITDSVLLETVKQQIDCLKEHELPGTFLVQYDALIRPEYQELLKEAMNSGMEIGGWWEITEPHCKDAGIEWRGRYSWDWHACVGFSIGYTPEERLKLVDVYMTKFKEIFGYYPRSVGSWFIDAQSLFYMREKYGIVASTACRDQIGTDGYNLWGGYWQGAYYPSKSNFYIPAQHKNEQIDVPVFRMLGSDPILQYDCGMGGKHQDVVTLEPAYDYAGGNPKWVDWFFKEMVENPAMTLSYFQVGQENMFTWRNMQKGFEYQIKRISELVNDNSLKVETLCESGKAFSDAHKLTPASAISALDGYDGSDKKTVWFNSRFYRMNLMWEGNEMFVRDIHLFDEKQKSLYFDNPCTTEYCEYWALPVVEGNVWSNDSVRASLRFYVNYDGGEMVEMKFGNPVIENTKGKVLRVSVSVTNYPAIMQIEMKENKATFALKSKKKLYWCAALQYAPTAQLPFIKVTNNIVEANYRGYPYKLLFDNASISDSINYSTYAGSAQAFTVTPKNNKFSICFN